MEWYSEDVAGVDSVGQAVQSELDGWLSLCPLSSLFVIMLVHTRGNLELMAKNGLFVTGTGLPPMNNFCHLVAGNGNPASSKLLIC